MARIMSYLCHKSVGVPDGDWSLVLKWTCEWMMKPSVSSTLVGTYQWDIRVQSQRPLPLHEAQHLQEMSLLSGWGSAMMRQREDWPILKAMVGKLGKFASGSPGDLQWSSVHPPALPLLCPSGRRAGPLLRWPLSCWKQRLLSEYQVKRTETLGKGLCYSGHLFKS